MKKLLIIAAIINVAVAIIHAIIGESDIVKPLLATDAPDTVRWTLHSAWHMISVVLFVSSFALFYLSREGRNALHIRILSSYIGVQYLGLAMVFVVTSVMYGIFFPQIIMLAPIGFLSILASRTARKLY